MSGSSIKVSVVIPNRDGRKWLEGCLNALRMQEFRNFEVIVADDLSTDESLGFVQAQFPDVRICRNSRTRGFAGTTNSGISAAEGEYILLLNNDTVPSPDFIGNLVQRMDTLPPETGSIASCMVRMDYPDRIDDAGDILTWYGLAVKRGHDITVANYSDEMEVFSACAGAGLYRRDFLIKTGGFDEKFESYLEDIDLGLRGHLLGFRCWYIPTAKVLHKGHGSRIPGGHYVKLTTRNRMIVFIKNVPLSLLVRHFPELLIGQVALFIYSRRPFSSLMGYLSFLPQLPHVIRKRRTILSSMVISNKEIEKLIEPSAYGIVLPAFISEGIGNEDTP